MPARCNRWFLLQISLLAQHVSGTIMPITRSSRILYRLLLPVVFGALVFKLSVWCGSNHLYNTLELLMMGVVVPETCWASNKICNKNHLLHLVGISFPHSVFCVIYTQCDFQNRQPCFSDNGRCGYVNAVGLSDLIGICSLSHVFTTLNITALICW